MGHIAIAKKDKSQANEITVNSSRFRSSCVLPDKKMVDEYQILYNVHRELKGTFDLCKGNFDTKGTVPFDRISMRGFIFTNGKCTDDVVLKNNISK